MMSAISGEPLLGPGLLLRAALDGTAWPGPDVELFSRARYALGSYLQSEGLTQGTLYVPAYICAEAVAGLGAGGPRVRYYPVGEYLAPDWAWLGGQEFGDGDSLLLVHYFGFPNDLERALDLRRERGLRLIEDCAHSFLTTRMGRAVGTFGDAGIYAYHKLLPIPDGAGLTRRSSREVDVAGPAPRSGLSESRAIARQVVKFGIYRSGLARPLLYRWRNGHDSAARPGTGTERGISGASVRLLRVLARQFERIVVRRRDNFQALASAFRHFPEAAPLFPDLDDGVCPYAFPVQVEDRARLIGLLRREGVAAYRWPDLPSNVAGSADFPNANQLGERVMLLPVHQDLGPKDVARIVAAYARIRSE
jgi:dTDP-4-amino-4,6-dideoxygalactose transaminase